MTQSAYIEEKKFIPPKPAEGNNKLHCSPEPPIQGSQARPTQSGYIREVEHIDRYGRPLSRRRG